MSRVIYGQKAQEMAIHLILGTVSDDEAQGSASRLKWGAVYIHAMASARRARGGI